MSNPVKMCHTIIQSLFNYLQQIIDGQKELYIYNLRSGDVKLCDKPIDGVWEASELLQYITVLSKFDFISLNLIKTFFFMFLMSFHISYSISRIKSDWNRMLDVISLLWICLRELGFVCNLEI